MSNDTLHQRIAAIKARVELESEMKRRGISLRASGGSTARLEGCCPFHDDSTPSLFVYKASQQFHCFGCGIHGDVIDFVQLLSGLTFGEALRALEQGQPSPVAEVHRATSVTRNAQALLPQRSGHHRSPSKPMSMPAENHAPILSVALSIYQEVLSRHALALSYLAERGIAPQTREQIALGYSDGQALRQALSGHAESWHAAQRAGLLTRGGKEWFSGRIIIPEVRKSKALTPTCVWMIGRLLPNLAPQMFVLRRDQRYLGLRFPKPLLGYAQAIENIHQSRSGLQGILLVEGAVDYVLARQWELPAVPVALLSTHPSRFQWEQLLHLQTISGLPVLDWHDADERGRLGALSTWERLHGYPRLMLPEIEGVKDLADVALHPFGLVQLAHGWQGMSDGDAL